MASACLANIIKHFGINMSTVDLDLDNDPVMAMFEQKPKVAMTFSEDPVVLACVAYRLGMYINLEELVPQAEDRELGARVRKHFMDKLVIQRLRGGQISAFREKLGAFLAGNRPIYKDEVGMLYHLPFFYFEDLARDELILSTQPIQPQQPFAGTLTLTPLTTLTAKRRSGAVKEFWWKDDKNQPYCISVRENAVDLKLHQSLWEFASITFESQVLSRRFHGTERWYYRLVNNQLRGVNTGQ